ncbi:hypothetical protein MTP99_012685 [Tenebrio molitor]|jgi:hypothetical protein|nr:hypothetical protein MTP99_012685 [Tenebrio molitor]
MSACRCELGAKSSRRLSQNFPIVGERPSAIVTTPSLFKASDAVGFDKQARVATLNLRRVSHYDRPFQLTESEMGPLIDGSGQEQSSTVSSAKTRFGRVILMNAGCLFNFEIGLEKTTQYNNSRWKPSATSIK